MVSAEQIVEITLEELPHLEVEEIPPVVTAEEYESRIEKARQKMEAQNLTHLVVYADREYFANIEFFTGYDPRFEEALLVIGLEGDPTLVVGNEGMDYAAACTVRLNKVLCQDFSLQGQPRNEGQPLTVIFPQIGIGKASRIGVVGMKYYFEDKEEDPYRLDIPAYMVDLLRSLAGKEKVVNATAIMKHPEEGLRAVGLSSTELALAEIASTEASLGLANFLNNLRLGMTEMEASKLLQLDGNPLPVHPNINFGRQHVMMGVASPTYTKRAELGEVMNVSNNRRRALVARIGVIARGPEDLKPEMKTIVDDFYKPYFTAMVNWYETVGLGVTGGEVYDRTMSIIGTKEFGVGLNPGHLIHTDEWVNTPFFKGSPYQLKSGMLIQCDTIAMPGGKFVGAHVEDGIALADAALRAELKAKYPKSWERIMFRRKFMQETLGVNLREEVLPLSNLQFTLHPYMLNPKVILAVKR